MADSALPRDTAAELSVLRESPQSMGMYSPASRIVGYIVSAPTPEARAGRLEAVNAGLGGDPAGRAAFASVLSQGQAPSMNQGETVVGDRMHDAFSRSVADGRMGGEDVRGIVRREAEFGGSGQAGEAPGTAHPGITQQTGRLSTYIDTLGHDARSEEARTAFTRESLTQAEAHRTDRPAASTQLYAQAANALADMPAANRAAELAALHRERGGDGVARFAAGATAGSAERVNMVDDGQALPERPFRADGLARIMNEANGQVAAAGAKGAPDAQRLSGQLFSGSSQYLADATGSDLDHALGKHDDKTGLRQALNGAVETNFPTILKQNMLPNGESLDPAAYRTVAGYARFEFDAPNDAHGRETVNGAQHALGGQLGKLQGDLLKSSQDGGRDLRADYGSTFGSGSDAPMHASRTLGELIGSSQNGINQGFDARADRTAKQQGETQEMFERVAGLAKISAKVAGMGGQEEVAGALETIEKTADALKGKVPQGTPSRSEEGQLLSDLRDNFTRQLGSHKSELANPMKDGANDASSRMSEYEIARQQGKTIAAAEKSQDGVLPGILNRTIVPSPDSVAHPEGAAEVKPVDLRHRLDAAIAEHNKDFPGNPLPGARDAHDWDRTAQHGTVLDLGDDHYAISAGRGKYELFTADQINNAQIRPNERADLQRDGAVHQAALAAPGVSR